MFFLYVVRVTQCGFTRYIFIQRNPSSPSGLTPLTFLSQPHLSSSPRVQARVTATATAAEDKACTKAASRVPESKIDCMVDKFLFWSAHDSCLMYGFISRQFSMNTFSMWGYLGSWLCQIHWSHVGWWNSSSGDSWTGAGTELDSDMHSSEMGIDIDQVLIMLIMMALWN